MIKDFTAGISITYKVRIASTAYNGGKCWMTLKSDLALADEDAEIQKSAEFVIDPEDASKVLAIIFLSSADTEPLANTETLSKIYHYDFRGISSDQVQVTTPLKGTVKVTIGSTRRITNV